MCGGLEKSDTLPKPDVVSEGEGRGGGGGVVRV